jgi:hypothetical protein
MFMGDAIATNYWNGEMFCNRSLDLYLFNDSVWMSMLGLDGVEWSVWWMAGSWKEAVSATSNHCLDVGLEWLRKVRTRLYPEFKAYEMWRLVAGFLFTDVVKSLKESMK